MMRRRGLVVLLLLLAVAGSSSALELVQLTSSDFEHETQAAGGQTTGHW
jgi:hypothetical protein